MGRPSPPVVRSEPGSKHDIRFQSSPRVIHRVRVTNILVILSVSILAVTTAWLATFGYSPWLAHQPQQPPHINNVISRCEQLRVPAGPPPNFNLDRRQSDRFEPGWAKPTLIKNAIIWTGRTANGTTHTIPSGDILLDKGVVQAIGHDLGLPSSNPNLHRQYPGTTEENTLRVVDAKGRWVTPGLVDVHSHVGTIPVPILRGASDGGSNKGAALPWLRSLDALNTHDDSYELLVAGGVTTSLVLPGSADTIGGQAFVIKMRKTREKSSSSMVLEPPFTLHNSSPTGDQPVRWRHIKHACGENPGRASKGTRMDTIWDLRNAYDTAKKLKLQQDKYCEDALARNWEGLGPFPEDLQWEALVDVLRGRVKVNTHCYEAVDFDAFIRLANEFEFPVAAFHHAGEAWLVPDLLKKTHGGTPTIALFATHARMKREAYRSSEFAPRILADNGIPVVMKSDHPGGNALNARFLLHEAQQAHYFGLSEDLALSSVTSAAADMLGMGHRIGYLEEGYDADLVIWDSHPLRLGATPTQVFIDGIEQLTSPVIVDKPTSATSVAAPPTRDFDEEAKQATLHDGIPPLRPTRSLPIETTTIVFSNVTSLYARRDGGVHEVFNVRCPNGASDSDYNGLMVVVRRGEVVCFDREQTCRDHIQTSYHSNNEVVYVDLRGGSISPALVTVGSAMGTTEMEMELSTGDGRTYDPLVDDIPSILLEEDGKGGFPILRAADALQFGTQDALLAYRAGVTTAVSLPGPNIEDEPGFILGFSTAFSLGAAHRLERGAIIQEQVGFHIHIGHSFANPNAPSMSTQIGALRRILLGETQRQRIRPSPRPDLEGDVEDDRAQPWTPTNTPQTRLVSALLTGQTTLVVHAHNADIIASLIALKRSIGDMSDLRDPSTGLHIHLNLKMTIVGGTEAHLLAQELAEERIGVILSPPRVFPSFWEMRRALPGPPLTQDSAVTRLVAHGVVVGLGTNTPEGRWSARLLPWDLGWAALESNNTLSIAAALEMGSTNIERLLGVRIENEGDSDSVAVVGGDLLSMEGKVGVVVSPRQGLVHIF